MQQKIKTMSPADANGRIFRNDGPINPVEDHDTAWGMALAEQKTIDKYTKANKMDLDTIESGGPVPNDYSQLRKSLDTPLSDQRHAASEKVRASTAGQSLEKAHVLYNLVELSPTSESIPSDNSDTTQEVK